MQLLRTALAASLTIKAMMPEMSIDKHKRIFLSLQIKGITVCSIGRGWVSISCMQTVALKYACSALLHENMPASSPSKVI